MFYWLMKYVVVGPIVKAIFRPWIVGRRNVPAEGGAILASNHLSFVDSIVIPLAAPRPVQFLAKSHYFTGTGLSGWVSYARILRSQVLGLRSREFVDAIHALGGSVLRIIGKHVLPNVRSSLVVIATLELARAIVLEATLSFLGLGIQPPTPSWGGMVQEGREYLDSAWWIATFPGLLLMATSVVVSRTGDWLRDLLDPTLRGE